ncbi:MAG: hypothetical protein ACRDPF_15395 [Streptosporangiaceae bacterium]
MNRTRLAGWALITGTIVATVAYVAAGTLIHGHGDARYTSSLWTPLNGIAVAGNILIVLGLPVILAGQGQRAARLTLVGYLGLFAALVMLNVSEGCIEAFVKPYLARHGGVQANPPTGWAVFENTALVCLVVGLICLGIAVIRARVFPRWVGALLIASPLIAFLGLPGPLAELSDYLAFIALAAIGLQVARAQAPRMAAAPEARHAVQTAT